MMKSGLDVRRHLRDGFVYLTVHLSPLQINLHFGSSFGPVQGKCIPEKAFQLSDILLLFQLACVILLTTCKLGTLSGLEFQDGFLAARGGGGGEPGAAQAPPLNLRLCPHPRPRPHSPPLSIVRPPLLFRSCLGGRQCRPDWSRLEPTPCRMESFCTSARCLSWTPLHVLLWLPPCAGEPLDLIWSPFTLCSRWRAGSALEKKHLCLLPPLTGDLLFYISHLSATSSSSFFDAIVIFCSGFPVFVNRQENRAYPWIGLCMEFIQSIFVTREVIIDPRLNEVPNLCPRKLEADMQQLQQSRSEFAPQRIGHRSSSSRRALAQTGPSYPSS